MKHLYTGGHQLDRILDKNFGYPRLSIYAGTDRNGQNEMERFLKVWVPVPYGTMGLHLYSENSWDDELEVQDEVNLWNRDTEKHWKALAIRLLDEQCGSLEAAIQRNNADLKKYRKKLKKLQEKD